MLDIESIVYSRIKYNFDKDIKATYPDLNFTTNNRALVDAKFPCVYIHLAVGVETGQDLENKQINAGNYAFQIDVYDNQSQNRTSIIMDEIVRIMKSMRFNIPELPIFDNTQSEYRSTARFQRVIGSGDTL